MARKLYLPDDLVKELKQSNKNVERKYQAYLKASEQRREVFRRAHAEGMSYYGISKALGGSPNDVRVAKIAQKGAEESE